LGAVAKDPSSSITYAAHTATCTFLLDAEGICRKVVMAPNPGKRRESAKTAAQCIGAQYVASLDASVAGCMVEMPRAGSAMLFARVDARGRVALVRSGAVTRFETYAAEDPFDDVSVSTSAPEVPPRKPAPSSDPDYDEASNRTQRIPAVSPADLARVDADADGDDLPTGAYASTPAPETLPGRTTLPSADPHHAETLRAIPVHLPTDEDNNPYARPARGALPRRSDPHVKAARSARKSSSRWPTSSAPSARRRDR
jgi:hypothetical protein